MPDFNKDAGAEFDRFLSPNWLSWGIIAAAALYFSWAVYRWRLVDWRVVG